MQSPSEELKGNAIVMRIRIAFTNSDDNSAIQAKATSIMQGFNEWWALATSWIEIASEEDFEPAPRPSTSPNWVRFWTDQGTGEVTEIVGMGFSVDCRMSKTIPLNPSSLQSVFTLASEGKQPPIEWLLIRDSRFFLYTRQWRRAVIDAGTASEVAIVKMIDEPLAETALILRNKLLSDNQGLKRRGELLTLLGGSLPSRFQQRLIEPRNDASHEGADPTELDARDAVEAAVEVVKSALPLTTFFVYDTV